MSTENELRLPSATPKGKGPFVFAFIMMILAISLLVAGYIVFVVDMIHYGITPLLILMVVLYFYYYRKYATVIDTPTSKVRGVFIGRVELQGTTRCDEPTTGYLSHESCVWTRYIVEEHYWRVVSNGKKTRVQTGWEQIDEHCRYVWFGLEDDTGTIQVNPKQANVTGEILFKKTVTCEDELYWGMCKKSEISGSTGKRRFTETTIRVDAPAYLFGYATIADDSTTPYIAWNKTLPMYEIHYGTEKDAISTFGSGQWGAVAGIVFIFCYAIYKIYFGDESDGPAGTMTTLSVVAVFTLLLYLAAWFWINYNRLISMRQRVHEGFAHLEVQYQRRADLIPNLVEAVKGYRDYEAVTQQSIAALRSLAMQRHAQTTVDKNESERQIFLLREAYPDLKANRNFLNLQQQLADTETRIALASEYYNDFATNSNARLLQFPICLVAKMTLLTKFPLITLAHNAQERAVPSVAIVAESGDAVTPPSSPNDDDSSNNA